MIKLLSTVVVCAYAALSVSMQAQTVPVDHDNHQHEHATQNSQPHDHAHVHELADDHEHVHNHGKKHSHDEISLSVFGTQAAHNGSFNSLPPVENCCTGFTSSKGIGYGFELAMTTPVSADGFVVTPHVGYQHMPVAFESFSTEKAFTGGVVSGTALFRHTLDVSWSVVTFGARMEYPLFGGFFLGLGLDGNFFATGRYHQTETLEEPSNLVFESGTRTRLDRNGYVRGNNDFVFSATGSARIRLVEKQIGTIGVDIFGRYSLPLQPLFNPQKWSGMYGNPPAQFYIDSYTVAMISAGLGLAF